MKKAYVLTLMIRKILHYAKSKLFTLNLFFNLKIFVIIVFLYFRFLKGECSSKTCLLSHDLVQEKMATCHFFINGCCTNETCPYLHVKVNSKAPICKDFIQGFCGLGQEVRLMILYINYFSIATM